MDKETKSLMRTVIDDELSLVPIMHQMHHYRDCKKFLKWLIHNRIIGHNLLEWVKIEHGNSVMSMVKFIVKFHNKEFENRPIILGRDWIK